jgi:hypothetical protein
MNVGELLCLWIAIVVRGCPCIVALELKFGVARWNTRTCDHALRTNGRVAPKSFEIDRTLLTLISTQKEAVNERKSSKLALTLQNDKGITPPKSTFKATVLPTPSSFSSATP